ncbi:MAG: DUF5009 domain-containing protein [Candidatus Aminicenantes bacterium]|nr:DUF5009 domain-containing protein [Candidatus Aminicenantes bacterium]
MNMQSQAGNFSQRLLSMDALRGFDMFWIIGGHWIFAGLCAISKNPVTVAVSTQLKHVRWEGFHFWDLIMPLFLFIVGAAMPFSFSKRLERGDSKKNIYIHISKRVVMLFFLGIVAQGNLLKFDLSELHIYSNTLQAIAAGYLIASVIMLNVKIKWQIGITAGMLLLFWALMSWIPVPGYGRSVLTPKGNLAIYLDKLLLGPFQDGTNYSWILSSLTFASTVMLGVMAGLLLRSKKSQWAKVAWLSGAGSGCLLVGWIWGFVFPIIKHLWTSSFVLFSGGVCLLLLALFYMVIDVKGWQKWAFGFKVIGLNAILVYMATRLFDFRLIGDVFVGGLLRWIGPWENFVRGLAGFAVIWLILFWMYRKRTFIKI